MISFPTSGDISIEVNGKTLAVAQSYRVRTSRESRPVEALGATEPIGQITGRCLHQLELSRVRLLEEDGVDFYALSGFNVVIAAPGRRVVYTGCEWSGIDESISLGAALLETVSIVATKRTVLT